MDLNSIRADFPILQEEIIYFDNACMTLRPRQVVEAMNEYYEKYSACAGRSNHQLAEKVHEKFEEARGIVANFIGAKENEIVFTRNTTEGINLIAHGLGLKAEDKVVTSDKEHNSNLVPWQIAGVNHVVVPSTAENTFDLEKFKELVEGARLVSIGYTANLDGVTVPLKEIIDIAHAAGALVLVDAAQAAGHHPINVKDLDADFLAFSGHKLLGPTGTGVLYGKYELLEKLKPFITGGDTVEKTTYKDHILLPPPEKFEAGLQDYAGIIGLGAAIKYLQKVGFEFIQKQEFELNKFVTEELSDTPIKIIGPTDPAQRGGIYSFYLEGMEPHQISLMLDQNAKIAIRSGQHCVHSWFEARDIDGSARASFYFYNSLEEVKIFVDHLKQFISII